MYYGPLDGAVGRAADPRFGEGADVGGPPGGVVDAVGVVRPESRFT